MVIIRFFQLGRALAVIGFPVLALNCASASRSPWVPVTRVSPPLKVKEVVSVVPDNQRTVTDRTYVVRYEPEKRCVETTTGRIERSTHTFSKGTFLTHLGVISVVAAGLTALVCKDASADTPLVVNNEEFRSKGKCFAVLAGIGAAAYAFNDYTTGKYPGPKPGDTEQLHVDSVTTDCVATCPVRGRRVLLDSSGAVFELGQLDANGEARIQLADVQRRFPALRRPSLADELSLFTRVEQCRAF